MHLLNVVSIQYIETFDTWLNERGEVISVFEKDHIAD